VAQLTDIAGAPS